MLRNLLKTLSQFFAQGMSSVYTSLVLPGQEELV